MPIFKHNDIEINYITEGEGEPLVLVHGTYTKLEAWNFQISYFKDKMNVIAFDNRGSGKSSRPNFPYSMDMYVEDVKNLLDHLNINQKIHLCGISMGGFIALSFALKYPEKVQTLILCATSAYEDQMGYEQRYKWAQEFIKLDIEQKIQFILPNLYSRAFRKKLKEDQNLNEIIKDDMNFIAYLKDSPTPEDYFNQLAAVKDYDVRDMLGNITQPILIMVGTKDRLVSLKESELLHEKIPNSKLEVFNNLLHGFTIEAADEVNHIMWNFLKEHLA